MFFQMKSEERREKRVIRYTVLYVKNVKCKKENVRVVNFFVVVGGVGSSSVSVAVATLTGRNRRL